MNKNNLSDISSFWNLYTTLSKTEAASFLRFVESPYFNSKKNLVQLTKSLTGLHLKKMAFSREEIHALAFGQKKYNGQVLNNSLTELKKLLLQFLQIEWLETQEGIKQLGTAETLLQKNHFDAFEKAQEKQQQNTNMIAAGDEYFYALKLKLLSDEYVSTTASKRKFDLLENCVYDLRTYYLTETMRMYCELVNRKNLKAVDFNIAEMQSFLNYYGLNPADRENPLLSIYYYIFYFLQHIDDENAFVQYKQLLVTNIHRFPRKTARELCLYGQNHCVKHINLNHHQYLNELFDMFNLMIREQILYEGKYITQWTFKNYITVAARIKEYDKAELFIEQYHNQLLPGVKHDAYHYNLANLYFEKHEYDKAMTELNQIHLTDAIYYLDARSMLLKIYFNRQDYEALQSLYHSVRTYLLRNRKISRKQAELYKNLFLYTYKLSGILLSRSFTNTRNFEARFQKLAGRIYAADIANKPWLLEKMQQS